MATRDVIVVGASAGGVAPLRRMAADLPHDLPASVFVVLHTTPGQPSALPQLLDRDGPLPAASAQDGQTIEPGRLYVAPPDLQLLLEPGRLRAVLGPTENRHRPSVDVLFRSAARAYGPRVVGVVLSGALDDGTAGLIAVKIQGGLAVVQDPAEAFCDGMPRSAMRYLDVDHVVPASSLGALLGRLARERVDVGEAPAPSREMVFETRVASLDPTTQTERDEDRPGIQSVVACPDCGGVLREIQEGDLLRFRCRTGHAYSPETMLEAGREGVERALWEALRTIEERLALRRRLVRQAKERRLDSLVRHFEEQALETQGTVESLRELLLQKVAD
ncbi:MAG TPA: chemotaxis protein CheB [Thermoanaerobaculia bacterium]|jgi:two-component system chemotaxis response regulator CheB